MSIYDALKAGVHQYIKKKSRWREKDSQTGGIQKEGDGQWGSIKSGFGPLSLTMCVGKYGIIPKMDLTHLKQSHDPVSHATVAELPNATKRA